MAWRYDFAAILRRRQLWCRSRVGEWFCGSENGDGFALLCLGVVPVPRQRGIRQNEAGQLPPAPRPSKRASEHQRRAFALSDFATGLVATELEGFASAFAKVTVDVPEGGLFAFMTPPSADFSLTCGQKVHTSCRGQRRHVTSPLPLSFYCARDKERTRFLLKRVVIKRRFL